MVTEMIERTKIQSIESLANIESKIAGANKHKVELDLTESEADCLLSCFSSMGKTLGSSLRQEELGVIAVLYVKLTDIFPTLIANESVMSFWEQRSRRSKNVAQGEIATPTKDILRYRNRDESDVREQIKTELTKLNKREEFIQAKYIREILGN